MIILINFDGLSIVFENVTGLFIGYQNRYIWVTWGCVVWEGGPFCACTSMRTGVSFVAQAA